MRLQNAGVKEPLKESTAGLRGNPSSRTFARRELRARLVALLGGCCSQCGRGCCLEFHSLANDGGAHHRLSSLGRLRWYLKVSEQDLVVLLCADCHRKVTAQRMVSAPDKCPCTLLPPA